MEGTLSKTKAVLFVIACCLTNIAVMSDMIFIPIADSLYANYDSVMVVNFILSGPALLAALSGFVSGRLMDAMGRKKLMIVAFSLFAVLGVISIFVTSGGVLAVLRGISGFMYGVLNATAMAMISAYYLDENQRGKMLGIYNSTVAISGSLISLAAGLLAVDGWHNALQLYWIMIPVLVFLMFSIPEQMNKKSLASSTENIGDGNGTAKTSSSASGKSILALCVSYALFNCFYMIINYESAVVFAEKSLGNSATFGIIAALMTVGSAIMCICFGFIFPKLKRATIVPAFFVVGLGYLVLYLSNNLFVCAAAAILMCGAYGLGSTYFMTWCPNIVSPDKVDRAMGYLVTAAGIGMFAATYFASALQAIVGSDLLCSIFPILFVVEMVAGTLSLILTIKYNRAHSSNVEDVAKTESTNAQA